MAQESGPLVGDNFTDAQWRAIFGGEPGIVGDVDGSAYNLTLGAGTDDALLGSTSQDSMAVVGGFMHRIAEDSTQAVTIPPSTNVVGRTDIIAVRLDQGTFTSAPGPCRLVRIAGVEGSASRPSMDEAPPGVEDFPLWAVTRKGNGTTAEGLNQAAKVDLRRRTGENLVVPSGESLPANVPLGTSANRGGDVYHRVLNVSNVAEWVPVGGAKAGGRVQRSTGDDVRITVANTDVLLASGAIGTVPAGRYRVDVGAVLYTTGAAANGYLLVSVNGNVVRFRCAINTGGAFPFTAQAFVYADHVGGPMSIGVGYRRTSISSDLWVAGASDGNYSWAQAERVSL